LSFKVFVSNGPSSIGQLIDEKYNVCKTLIIRVSYGKVENIKKLLILILVLVDTELFYIKQRIIKKPFKLSMEVAHQSV
jgi:hypothetical protein